MYSVEKPLSSIANKYGMSTSALAQKNRLRLSARLKNRTETSGQINKKT